MKIALFGFCCLILVILGDGQAVKNQSLKEAKCSESKPCKDGLVLPVWHPTGPTATFAQKLTRGSVYFLLLMYLFYGVSIVSDRFMAAIEVITSKEKEVCLRKPDGSPYYVLIRVWNETVSNLTLMALGSSAPEILLSIIEVFTMGYEAGDLGPSTIVGSASFNFFIIIAICIMCVPAGEVRTINRLDVFWVTVIWSTFAYIWLYLILVVFTPNVVTLTEALMTFAFFPLTVASAFFANKKTLPFGQKILEFRRQRTRNTMIRRDIEAPSGPVSPKSKRALNNKNEATISLLDKSNADNIAAFEQQKAAYMQVFHDLRNTHPDLSLKELEELTTHEIFMNAPRSRAFYRIQAGKEITGGGKLNAKAIKKKAKQLLKDENLSPPEIKIVTVEFESVHYMCLENCGIVATRVKVDRGSLSDNIVIKVNYRTESGTAGEHTDYIPTSGTLMFRPTDQVLEIPIKIIDNDVYEDDEDFKVILSQVTAYIDGPENITVPARLGPKSQATVVIIDDDHAGYFLFRSEAEKVSENSGTFSLEVQRSKGARGEVHLPFTVANGTAINGRDFVVKTNEIIFKDGQSKGFINIDIINDDEYEKSEDFYVLLNAPYSTEEVQTEGDADGSARLGEHVRCRITITEDKEFKNFVDKMLCKANTSILVGTSSWKQQFAEVFEVEDANGDGVISMTERILHAFAMPWKLLFAIIPPTDAGGGWLCFIVSIIFIGILTAFIGDAASLLGCAIGLKDTIVAISIVALGTSVPDTFASKIAAVHDKYADSSIGNVTGSNAVNVFLGIGIAWSIAAFHHFMNGTEFRVDAGSLTLSVVLFIIGSMICITVLMIRRKSEWGGELGGPAKQKYAAGALFIFVWIIYILINVLDNYCIISF